MVFIALLYLINYCIVSDLSNCYFNNVINLRRERKQRTIHDTRSCKNERNVWSWYFCFVCFQLLLLTTLAARRGCWCCKGDSHSQLRRGGFERFLDPSRLVLGQSVSQSVSQQILQLASGTVSALSRVPVVNLGARWVVKIEFKTALRDGGGR